MRSVNKVIIIGNLTRDPEMRQTPSGQNVTTFGVATNREWVTSNGEKKSSAQFHECVSWAKLAEICNKFLKKGNLVYVEGYLKTRSWEAEDGIKKFKTEIVVQDMIILEKKKDKDDNEEYAPRGEDEEDETKTDDSQDNSPKDSPNESQDDQDDSEEAPKEASEDPEVEEKEEKNSLIDKDLGL